MHPRYHLEKEYIVTVRRELNEHNLNWLRKGIELEGKVTQPAQIRLIKKSRGYISYRMVIHEGRKRQIREMFKAAGHPVLTLKRVAIGSVHLGTLATGRYRPLTRAEVEMLRKAAGLVSGKRIENKEGRESHERRGISGVRNK
jgi:pseudouridine synthase